MKNRQNRRRKNPSPKNRVVVVREVWHAEPDIDKLAKALLEHVINKRRQTDPASVQWYYDKRPWLDRDKSA